MTRKETEYHAAVLRLRAEQERLAEHHEYMEGLGITSDEMQWVLDPQRSFSEEAKSNEPEAELRSSMLVTGPRQARERAGVPLGVPALTPGRRAEGHRQDQQRRPAMIRNENEYQEAVLRLCEERERLAEHCKRLDEMGLAADEMKRALDPLRSFHEQLAEEVESYERLKRGEMGELRNLHELGTMLVALRITLGLTQRELAERLGVHESQVSRDERNEYHAVTVERASRILDALGVDLRSVVEVTDVPHEFEVSDDPD